MSKLTLKQQFFVKHYVIGRNATKAAIAAGYSENCAEVTGCNLLRNPKVKAEIEKIIGKQFDQLDVSSERILNELALVGFARMRTYIEVRGHNAYVNLAELTDEQSAAITELTSDVLLNGGGEDEDPVEIKRTKIKLGGKLEALKMLAMYRKLLTEKHEHSGEDGGPMVLWIGKEKPSERTAQ